MLSVACGRTLNARSIYPRWNASKSDAQKDRIDVSHQDTRVFATTTASMTKRESSAATNNNAGPRRMGLYQRCIAQFNEALGQEFFIEAVAIAESLIADRLESRLAHKHEQIEEKRRFSTIGKLAAELNGKKADEPGEARELYSEIRI